jgi:hypothetical protein
MDVAMLLPSLEVLAAIATLYVAWWVLGDFVLDQIGIPFLDGVWSGGSVWDMRAETSRGGGRDAWRKSAGTTS